VNQLAKPRLLTLVVNERSGGGRAGRMLPKVARTGTHLFTFADYVQQFRGWGRGRRRRRHPAHGLGNSGQGRGSQHRQPRHRGRADVAVA